MSDEQLPRDVAVLRHSSSHLPSQDIVIDTIERDLKRKVDKCAVNYPVKTKDLRPYGKCKASAAYLDAIVFTFDSCQDALAFYIEAQQSIYLSNKVILLQPEPKTNGAAASASTSEAASSVPPSVPCSRPIEARSLLLFGEVAEADANTVRGYIESQLREMKSDVRVECVLGPLHSAEIEDGADRPCMLVTLSAAEGIPTIAAILESTGLSAHQLPLQLMRECSVYLDTDLFHHAAKSKKMAPDKFLLYIQHFYGVTINMESEMSHQVTERLKCSGHWIQIRQLEQYFRPSSHVPAHDPSHLPHTAHDPSHQPHTAHDPNHQPHTAADPNHQPHPAHDPSHTDPNHQPHRTADPNHQRHPVATPCSRQAGVNGQTHEPMDTSDGDQAAADVRPKTSVSHRQATETGEDATVARSTYHQRDFPDVHTSARKAAASRSTSPPPQSMHPSSTATSTFSHTTRRSSTSTSPPPQSTSPSPSTSGSSLSHVSRSSSHEESRSGAQPKKSYDMERQFHDTVPASGMIICHLVKHDRLQTILNKLPGVSIANVDGGIGVGAVTEKELSRTVSLLKDEIKALEDNTETYDYVDDRVKDSHVQKVVEELRKRHPDVQIKQDKARHLLVICGEDAAGIMTEAVTMLLSATPLPVAKCRSEDIAVDKDIMVYLKAIDMDKLEELCQTNKVEIDISEGEDIIMCAFTGSKEDVKTAARKMQQLVKKYSLKLTSENVLIHATLYKEKHRVFDDVQDKHKQEVLFCYNETHTKLYLVGEGDKVKAVREEIEALMGTKRKRGSSLKRRSPKLDTEVEKRDSAADTKARYDRLTKTISVTPTAAPTASLSSEYMKSFQYGSKTIHVLQYDITKLHVDMIVNSANCVLKHNHGVARAIAKAAGPELSNECNRYINQLGGSLLNGSIFISAGGTLPCKNVLHAVSPSKLRHDPVRGVPELEDVLRKCLEKADAYGVTSLAFPPLGGGVLGAPPDIVGEMFARAVSMHFLLKLSASIQCIYIVDIAPEMVKGIQSRLVASADFREIPFCGDHPGMVAVTPTSRPLSAFTPPATAVSRHLRSYADATRPKSAALPVSSGPMKALPPATAVRTSAATTSTSTHHSSKDIDASGKLTASASAGDTSSTDDTCTICMCPYTNPTTLDKCKHTFCTDCISECFKKMKPVCPVCGTIYGKITGDQPEGGTMRHYVEKFSSLQGYLGAGTIVIDYYIPGGVQGPSHPSPGKRYTGATRTAYLPNNTEGKKVLALLKRAFDARLMFTIGRSVTSGQDNIVTWNDIHHKTSRTGGPARFGYPDPTYLKRVQEELAAKGIK